MKHGAAAPSIDPLETMPRTSLPRFAAVLLTAVLGLLLLVVAARPAAAHASLEQTTPSDGEHLEEAPERVGWTFNEPVTSTTGALRVFNAEGERVDTGVQGHPAPDRLTLELRDDVGTGNYIATYRVTSADGHLIRGAFVFSVGDAGAVDEATLSAIFTGGGTTSLAIGAGVVRAIRYLGALLLGGALLWAAVVARGRDDEQAGAVTWARRGAVATAVAAALVIPLQAMLTSGLGLSALGNATVLGETVASSVGISALVCLAAAVLVLLTVGDLRVREVTWLGGLVVLGSFLVSGHTRTVDPAWVLYLGDSVHLLAGAAWFGGLVLLARTVRARRLDDDPVGAADVVARFSRMATWALVAVVVAGSAMGWALVRQPRALVGTDYGWTLLVKVALVGMVILVGAYNNRRLVPAITRAAAPAGAAVDTQADPVQAVDPDRRARIGRTAWGQLRRTARFEVAVLVAVLGVTAFLVNLRPAAEAAGITGAFDTLVAIDTAGPDDLQLNLVVDPNQVGHNEIHFYLFDETGRPVSDLSSVEVHLTQPARDIGPIVREPSVAGPGHWLLEGNALAVPGRWVIELVVGLDRFEETRVEVPVVVNP